MNPLDPSLPFTDWELMLTYLGNHYKTQDLSQWSKNKLDNFRQNDRNYWSWKAELDELALKPRRLQNKRSTCSVTWSPLP